ncbi:hypothetical protein ABK046_17915 [Streptomyces caeruleatus]
MTYDIDGPGRVLVIGTGPLPHGESDGPPGSRTRTESGPAGPPPERGEP